MENILELILSILFIPFKDDYDSLFYKIKKIPNKFVRIVLRILLISVSLAVLVAIYFACMYVFRGWF
jgi:hypothetical protein